jgi:hypothetical protein
LLIRSTPGADPRDDTDVLVADRSGLVDLVDAAVGNRSEPLTQVATVLDDRVGRFDDRRVGSFFDSDVAGAT